jgi:hypothetical protein
MSSPIRKLVPLNKWAHLLGWRDLYLEKDTLPAEIAQKIGFKVLYSFMCGQPSGIFLQVNLLPQWQAAVYAVRHRICTGWHNFEFNTETIRRREAARLHDILAAKWFFDPAKRRIYRKMHPEYTGYTWRRLGEEGPPGGVMACFKKA